MIDVINFNLFNYFQKKLSKISLNGKGAFIQLESNWIKSESSITSLEL